MTAQRGDSAQAGHSAQLPFPEQIAAHCFFACGHVERGEDPGQVHRGMESHYASRHAQAIAQIVDDIKPRTYSKHAERSTR